MLLHPASNHAIIGVGISHYHIYIFRDDGFGMARVGIIDKYDDIDYGGCYIWNI